MLRAVVTGAGSGIGWEVALRLAHRGANLVLVDVDGSRLDELTHHIEDTGTPAVPVVGDLADPLVCEQVVATAQQHLGGLDALISNAGMMNNCTLLELDDSDWQRVFDVNVRAAWLLAKYAHPMLKAARGSIVFTGSIAASHPIPAHGAYSASKAALVMLARQIANEWGPDGIRANVVSPGMVVTGMSREFYADQERRRAREAVIPLRAIGEPSDIAPVVEFLTSPAAAYLTGQEIVLDGGLDTVLMTAARGLAERRS